MQNIKIKNSLDCCTIDIEGAIGVAEEWQFENAGERVATYEKFREVISKIEALEATCIVVNIRSTGGDVGDAMLIYEALASLDIPITTRCYGYVASAATVIAQAASAGKREISANALYLVHNSTCAAEGNATELASRVDLLLKTDERLADLYARRSGRDAETFRALMNEEGGNGRWLTAQEAIEAGLADAIIDATEQSDDSSIKNFWRKLGAKLGLNGLESEAEALAIPQNNHSVYHAEDITQSEEQRTERAVQQIKEQQKTVKATKLSQIEDPSLAEVTPAKNQKAYQSDVQAFKR